MSDKARDNLSSADAKTVAGPELPGRLLDKLRVTIPGYELLDRIASGGQATVYRARELTSGLTVAVKILHGGSHADEYARQRLRRETAALRALNHPNIVCVVESGRTPLGLDFLVMNYVEGRSFDAIWKDPKFSAAVAPEPSARLRLFKRICDIIQIAHLKGITHRDLSPSNILVTDDGEPHVLDFGLVSTPFNDLLTASGQPVSVTGQFIGKVQYAAPEQARGGRDAIDIRTDVYALGVMLYQILTNGAFPYEVVGNLIDVLNNIVHSKPLPPSACRTARRRADGGHRPFRQNPPLVNGTIEAVVLKALEKDPSRRYQSAGELAADIDQYLAGRPTAAGLRGSDSGLNFNRQFRVSRGRLLFASVTLILTSVVLVSMHGKLGRKSSHAENQSSQPTVRVAERKNPVLPFVPSIVVKSTVTSQPAVPVVAPPASPRKINILAYIEPEKDAISGKWRMEEGRLWCDEYGSTIELPYAPPEEYDFTVTFIREDGVGGTGLTCVANLHQFAWSVAGWKNNGCAFSVVGSDHLSNNPTTYWYSLPNGTQCTTTVKVRRLGVEGYIDGKLVSSLRTDYENLRQSPNTPALKHPDRIALSTGAAKIKVNAIEILEVTGEGKLGR